MSIISIIALCMSFLTAGFILGFNSAKKIYSGDDKYEYLKAMARIEVETEQLEGDE